MTIILQHYQDVFTYSFLESSPWQMKVGTTTLIGGRRLVIGSSVITAYQLPMLVLNSD